MNPHNLLIKRQDGILILDFTTRNSRQVYASIYNFLMMKQSDQETRLLILDVLRYREGSMPAASQSSRPQRSGIYFAI